VDDSVVSRDALCELIGDCPEVKPLLIHLKREHGRGLTCAQIILRVCMDSQAWLAEHNQRKAGTGAKTVSAFAAVDHPVQPKSAGGQAQQGANATAPGYYSALATFAEQNPEAALALFGPKGKGKGKGKGRGKGQGKGAQGASEKECLVHLFEKAGCKKPDCKFKHNAARLGKFEGAQDAAGRVVCRYYAMFGAGQCWKGDECPFAHTELEGVRCMNRDNNKNIGKNNKMSRNENRNKNARKNNNNNNEKNNNNVKKSDQRQRGKGKQVAIPAPRPAEVVSQEVVLVSSDPKQLEHHCACALGCSGGDVSVGNAVIDNACTTTILGKNAIPYIRERWEASPAIVRTANGETHVSEKGSVMTVHGLISGYIVEESDFSLWSLDEALKSGYEGQYIQTLNDAYIEFAYGEVVNFEREGKLWVIELFDNDYVPVEFDGTGSCYSGEHEVAVEALATRIRTAKKSIHHIQGHRAQKTL
jgi:hypothetical protein